MPSNTAHILIVANDKDSLQDSAKFLTEKGYQVTFARNVLDATAKVAMSRPQIVFLSLHLADVTIEKIFSLFVDKLKLETVIFPELKVSYSICQELKKQYPHVLIPPTDGLGIHIKTQEILFKNYTFEGNALAPKSSGLIYTRKNQVPPQIYWDEVPGGTDTHKMWQSRNKEKDSPSYFYKGQKPPQYNKEKSKWETDVGGTFFINPGPKFTGVNSEYRDLLTRCLESALGESLSKSKNSAFELDFASKTVSLLFTSIRYSGFLVLMDEKNNPSEKLLAEVFERLRVKMEQSGIPLSTVSTPIKLELSKENTKTAEKVLEDPELDGATVKFQIDNTNGAFVFIPIEAIPQTIDGPNPDSLGIAAEKHLMANLPLTFDLYLHLPKNEKLVHYLSKGTILSPSTLQKLLKFQTHYVYIKAEDKNLFFDYCLRKKLSKAG